MRCSLNWLKEYATGLPSAKAAALALTMSGTEVESISEVGVCVTNVVIAEVLSVGKHPNADKLSLCEVRTDRETYSVVCGAKNMLPGDKVALALVGAELPGGVKIKRSKIRGVESQGMMCSEVELGIKDTSDGIMILPPEVPLGLDIATVIGGRDAVLDVSITPNRADLLSIRGIARELAVVTGAVFKDKTVIVDEAGANIDAAVSVLIADGAPCNRYCARVIKGVTIGPSPDAIRKRLEAAGIRAINNVVDVTNYGMLETGQPLHAFDLDKVDGRRINVRLAREGELIQTLDGKTRTLDPSMLVIADASAPIALAGVMGGKHSEVSDATKDVILEAAWFEPSVVRRTAKKTGLSTDSSYRFERGVDIGGVSSALDMAAGLIVKVAGGVVAKGAIDLYRQRPAESLIRFRTKRAEKILGMTLNDGACLEIFNALGIKIKEVMEGEYLLAAPSFRVDIKTETDLIEEVARVNGYDKIPVDEPVARLTPPASGRLTQLKSHVAGLLVGAGFYEVVNYSFVARPLFELATSAGVKAVEVLNPISDEQSVMRPSLVPSLLENLRYNLQRKNDDVRIFEFAPVFASDHKESTGVKEVWRISGLIYGPRYAEAWNSVKDWTDFYDCKGVVERLFNGLGTGASAMRPLLPSNNITILHPGKSAAVFLDEKEAGYVGELHPDVMARFDIKRPAYVFELDANAILSVDATKAGRRRDYTAVSRFPESVRDIAFIISDSLPYENIVEAIRKLDAKLIESVSVFDVYYGQGIEHGNRSMALRVVYRSTERTLTSEDVDALHAKVAQALASRFDAKVRGEKES